MTSNEVLAFAVGVLLSMLTFALLHLFYDKLSTRRRQPSVFTWKRLDSGEEEVVLNDGRVLRGKGVAWYFHPHGTFAPDWLAKWLCAQSRAAKSIHAVNTGRKRFVFELEEQKRKERRNYGDN
jgi:hypothetical protein